MLITISGPLRPYENNLAAHSNIIHEASIKVPNQRVNLISVSSFGVYIGLKWQEITLIHLNKPTVLSRLKEEFSE